MALAAEVVMRLAWALVIVIGTSACATTPAPPPVVVEGCRLTAAPPARPHLVFVPCEYELCLDTPNAAAWDAYEDELRAWALDAWTRCRR